jgi:hypothetical protein
MSPADWTSNIQQAFVHDTNLANRILQASVDSNHSLLPLFDDIAQYIRSQQKTVNNNAQQEAATAATKKRKLDGEGSLPLGNPNPATVSSSSANIQNRITTFECDGVSISVPARKKLKLEFSVDAASTQQGEIRLLTPTDSSIEYTLPTASIDQAFCLPVPEKQARQWNFCIFPHSNALAADGTTPLDQLVFTMNEPKAGAEVDDVFNTETQLNALLAPYNRTVTRPSDAEFASSIPQSHRKGETAYHVKAHRGSKEGYLFFLPHGVVFGFKKPLVFFPFGVIESVSYTSVLQRTFNLVVAATEPGAASAAGTGEVKETEFSMLDQADFAGIDAYIKKHGLNDASMAAQRRAKAYNVNKDNKKVLTSTDANGGGLALVEGEEEEEGGVEDDAGRQKTEQELQDEEDELEEDYEASGGESDGEGEDSGEDDGEEGDAYEDGYDEDNE